MITNKEFTEATLKFDKVENRSRFYSMAVELANRGFEIEADLLILATWNSGGFRYAIKEFDVDRFEAKIKSLNACFDKMKNESFRTINFDRYEDDIVRIFEELSQIKGVQFTGASKVMHLKNRNVFVMWDNYIRGHKSRRYYHQLSIAKEGDWTFKKYGNDGKSYFQFQKEIQNSFRHINFQHSEKTFPKAIDEFNYVKITLPIQHAEKVEREQSRRHE